MICATSFFENNTGKIYCLINISGVIMKMSDNYIIGIGLGG